MLGNGAEMLVHTFLVRFHIERNNGKSAVDARFLCFPAEKDGIPCADSADISHNRNFFTRRIPAYSIHNGFIKFQFFFRGHGGAFTGGAAYQNAFGTVGHQVLCQCGCSFVVYGTIFKKWSNHGGNDPSKFCCCHFLVSPLIYVSKLVG